MSFHYVFAHGFGFAAHFWRPLIEELSIKQSNYTCLEAGYFGAPIIDTIPANVTNIIGIGHSLGLKRLLALPIKYRAIINISGFTDFLGDELTLRTIRLKNYLAFRRSFLAQPIRSLQRFYVTCNLTDFPINSPVNLPILADDLIKLSAKDTKLPAATPILTIYSYDDQIVTPELIMDNFTGFTNIHFCLINSGGHGLAYQQPKMLSKKISEFINGL